MKALRLGSLFLVFFAYLAVVPLSAQTGTIDVQVPYAFVVENSALPAGEYRISAFSDNTLIIRSQVGDTALLCLTIPAGGGPKAVEPQLVFQHYGNQYFLAEVWLKSGRGRELNRYIYETTHKIDIAGGNPERVVLMAKK